VSKKSSKDKIMELACLKSGSKGNCYILKSNNGNMLLLDLGVTAKEISANKVFTSWFNVGGAIVTHSHKDHSAGIKEISSNGIQVYYEFSDNKLFIIDENWAILPFDCVHDVPTKGFIIKDLTENKVIVYATDTAKLPPIKNVDFWLVECNNDYETLNDSIQNGELDYEYLGRVMETHLGLEYLVEYFNNSVIKKPEWIIACHLSNENSNAGTIRNKLSVKANNFDIARAEKRWKLC